jgi:hypothetical protein
MLVDVGACVGISVGVSVGVEIGSPGIVGIGVVVLAGSSVEIGNFVAVGHGG